MPYPSPSRLSGRIHRHYWSERAHERTEFLTEWVSRLEAERIPTTVHEGWTRSDLTVFPHGWTSLQACTVQEDHSGGRRLLRVRLGLAVNGEMRWAASGAAVLAAVGLGAPAVPVLVVAAVLAAVAAAAWRVGLERRSRAAALADDAAFAIGMIPVDPDAGRELASDAAQPSPTEAAAFEVNGAKADVMPPPVAIEAVLDALPASEAAP